MTSSIYGINPVKTVHKVYKKSLKYIKIFSDIIQGTSLKVERGGKPTLGEKSPKLYRIEDDWKGLKKRELSVVLTYKWLSIINVHISENEFKRIYSVN